MRQPHRDGYRNTRNDSRHGCHVLFGGVFRGRKRLLLHHLRNRGGRPGCASHLNVDPAHSLPQQRSAGRNLITVFFTVNYPRATFYGKLHVDPAGNTRLRHPHIHRCRRAHRACNAGAREKHRKKSTIRFRPARATSCVACAPPAAAQFRACEKKMSARPDFDPLRTCPCAPRGRFCANTSHPREPSRTSRRSRTRPSVATSSGGRGVACGHRSTPVMHRNPTTDHRRRTSTRPPHQQGDRPATRHRTRGCRKRKRPHKAAVSVYPRRPDQWSSFSSSSA